MKNKISITLFLVVGCARAMDSRRVFSVGDGYFKCVAVSVTGTHAIAGCGDSVYIWDLNRDEHACTSHRILRGHTGYVECVACTADGRYALTGSQDTTVRMWDMDTGACVKVLTGHRDWVIGLAIMPDGAHAITCSLDGTVRVWDLNIGACKKILIDMLAGRGPRLQHRPSTIAIMPNAQQVLIGSVDGTVQVVDWQSGARAYWLEQTSDPGQSARIVHDECVSCQAVTPDGAMAAICSFDQTVRLWDLRMRQCLYTLAHVNGLCAAATPDSRQVVVGATEPNARVIDMQTGSDARVPTGHNTWINGIAVLPYGRRCVTTSFDGTVRVWPLV